MVRYEGRLNKLLFGHGLKYLGHQLALTPGIVSMASILFENGYQFFASTIETYVFPCTSAGQLDHRPTRPLTRQIDILPLVRHLQRATRSLRSSLNIALCQIHHSLKITECLIGLHRSKLRVVIGIHTFVAKLTTNFKHLLKTTHQQALQVQFGGNTQVVLTVECVMVRLEGTRIRATQNGVQDRRLNFVEALILHIASNSCDNLKTLLKRIAHFGIHDQVDIALTIARLFVGQAVKLFG